MDTKERLTAFEKRTPLITGSDVWMYYKDEWHSSAGIALREDRFMGWLLRFGYLAEVPAVEFNSEGKRKVAKNDRTKASK